MARFFTHGPMKCFILCSYTYFGSRPGFYLGFFVWGGGGEVDPEKIGGEEKFF